MAVGDHSASNITGSLGSTGEHGYVRFFKEVYSDNIRLKSMQLKNSLGAYVEREVMNGAPLQIRSIKQSADFGTNTTYTGTTGGIMPGLSDYTDTDLAYQGIAGHGTDGTVGPLKNMARFTEFTYYTIPTEYRTIIPDFWDLAHAYDWRDKKALLRDARPDSQMMKSVLGGFERAVDRYILGAMDSDVLVNDGIDTVPGVTKHTFAQDGGSTVPVEQGSGTTGEVLTGRSLTTAKLREARRIMEESNAVMPGDPIICAVHPRQISHLLADPEVKSFDYNTVRPLASGQIITWMGMTIVPVNQIAALNDGAAPSTPSSTAPTNNPFGVTTGDGSASTGRYVYCFTPGAVTLGVDPVTTQMDVIAHRRHMMQVSHYSCMGAIRTDGTKIVRIECVDGA